jgi:hypothetical protein
MYVWLHGGGEFGSDNRVQVSCSNLLDWTKDDVQDIFGGSLYVLAIQTQRSPHNHAYLMEAILEVCNEYDIDMSRIYIAGCSAGGYGTNNTIAAYPNFFAAAMPNCASAITPEAAETLTNLPVMLIHALNDTSVTPLNSITSYNNLKAAGSDKVWINMFTQNPPNPVTGTPYMGHWSGCWIHDNYTSNEEEFVKGEDVFVRDGVEYPYVSTQLSEIGDGYATIAHWLAAQQRENVIYADNVTGEQGDEVIIPVSIAGNTGISSVTVQLNCEQLTVTEVTAGEVLKDTAAFEFNPANGKMIWAGENAITEDGVLFYVKAVIADPTADGAYDIDLEVLGITDANASDVNSSAADAILYVVNPHYPGDVNLDGSIDNRDLIMLARYLVDLVTFNEEQMVLADFNEDGRIDNKDLVLLARYIVSEP